MTIIQLFTNYVLEERPRSQAVHLDYMYQCICKIYTFIITYPVYYI